MDKANSVVRARGQLVFYLLNVKGDGFMLMVRKTINRRMDLIAEAHVCRRIQGLCLAASSLE